MISSTLEKLYRMMARKKVSRISLVITIIITIILMKIDTEVAGFGGKGAFYLQISFTKSNFAEILSSWRSGGVELLVNLLWLNYINAISYSILFASAIAFFAEERRNMVPEPVRLSTMAFMGIPFAAAIFDWISNTLLYLLFSGWSLKDELIMAFSLFSSMKWVLVVLSLAILLKNYFSFRKVMKGNISSAR